MKILFLSDLWKPFPGGAENYVFNVALQLHDRGHEISIVTSYEKAVVGHPDFKLVQELDLGRRENREQRAKVLHEHVEKLSPDVIFIHRYFAEEYGALVQTWGRPVVEIVHQYRKLTGAPLYIFNSKYTMNATGSHATPHIIIHPMPSCDCVTNESYGDMIGFVKPLPGKGVDFFYQIADRFPDRKFLILRGEWQACETIQERPNITFIDPVSKMSEFYSRCNIVLMPSLSEDAGTIPQESAINNIPCISSDVMGLPETNAGGIVIPLDLNRWVEEINKLSDMTSDYYDKTADIQSACLESFDWGSKFDQLHETLLRLKR